MNFSVGWTQEKQHYLRPFVNNMSTLPTSQQKSQESPANIYRRSEEGGKGVFIYACLSPLSIDHAPIPTFHGDSYHNRTLIKFSLHIRAQGEGGTKMT